MRERNADVNVRIGSDRHKSKSAQRARCSPLRDMSAAIDLDQKRSRERRTPLHLVRDRLTMTYSNLSSIMNSGVSLDHLVAVTWRRTRNVRNTRDGLLRPIASAVPAAAATAEVGYRRWCKRPDVRIAYIGRPAGSAPQVTRPSDGNGYPNRTFRMEVVRKGASYPHLGTKVKKAADQRQAWSGFVFIVPSRP
jgi:hypothetical protein